MGQAVFKKLQYSDTLSLGEIEIVALRFHLQIINRCPPRELMLAQTVPKPLLLYSDTEFTEGHLPRIGFILYRDVPLVPLGFSMVLPHSMVRDWVERRMQIFPAETAAVPLALATLQEAVQGRDVVAFCDNEAAVSTLVRGASKAEDVTLLAELTHAFLLVLGCRLWVDWVDSKSNPADGLSRDGIADEWTARQGYSLHELPSFLPPASSDIFRWCEQLRHWARG